MRLRKVPLQKRKCSENSSDVIPIVRKTSIPLSLSLSLSVTGWFSICYNVFRYAQLPWRTRQCGRREKRHLSPLSELIRSMSALTFSYGESLKSESQPWDMASCIFLQSLKLNNIDFTVTVLHLLEPSSFRTLNLSKSFAFWNLLFYCFVNVHAHYIHLLLVFIVLQRKLKLNTFVEVSFQLSIYLMSKHFSKTEKKKFE